MNPTYSKGARTPWATATNFRHVAQDGEDGLVSQRYIDNPMVSERAQGSNDGGFLTSARSRGGYENPGILAPIRSALPFLARGVPEGLPLRRKIPVTGRNAKEKAIIALKDVRGDQGNIRRLARGVQLGKHFLREGLLHPI